MLVIRFGIIMLRVEFCIIDIFEYVKLVTFWEGVIDWLLVLLELVLFVLLFKLIKGVDCGIVVLKVSA